HTHKHTNTNTSLSNHNPHLQSSDQISENIPLHLTHTHIYTHTHMIEHGFHITSVFLPFASCPPHSSVPPTLLPAPAILDTFEWSQRQEYKGLSCSRVNLYKLSRNLSCS